MSRNEEETVENLWVQESFYLNMSNCKPDTKLFGAKTKIDLQKKTSKQSLWLLLNSPMLKNSHSRFYFRFYSTDLLAILLGLFGALLVLLIILTVVCVAFR